MALYGLVPVCSALALTSLLFGCGGGGGSSPASVSSVSAPLLSSSSAPASSAPASSAPASSAPASSGLSTSASSSVASERIKLNQVGFMPESAKWAVVPDLAATAFTVIDSQTHAEVFSGTLSASAFWDASGETVKRADFSGLTTPGDYRVRVAGLQDSYPFTIATEIYAELHRASIKAFYFNRSSAELLSAHAGVYARPLGHPDTQVLVHASAASAERPAGTSISSPKGWYDAGDYNKYIVNSGISTYSLLAAYEHFPDLFDDLILNIPESDDALPDLLNEALWNLDWMLTMQDPADGGVYHKLTNKNFDGIVMPHQATSARYVVQKTTAAALNFAAVMATASRVVAQFEDQLPGLSAQMLSAAESAWEWAIANPNRVYQQPSDIFTGEYGDSNLADEFAWAAAELYITTQEDSYYTAMKPTQTQATVPSWADVRGLAWMSLAHHRTQLSEIADQQLIVDRIQHLASALHSTWLLSPYRVTMVRNDFVWGSNSVALGQAMMLLQGYRLTGQQGYLNAAQSMLDYVLGRNPTDTSFVTGFGAKSTLRPHHRASEADAVIAPIPGFIAGGPQPGQQDKSACSLAYPSNLAAKSYLDDWCSYASNEVAINWNAPLVYVIAALKQLTQAP